MATALACTKLVHGLRIIVHTGLVLYCKRVFVEEDGGRESTNGP